MTNIGMYFIPDFISPFFMVDITIAENVEPIVSDTIENILKSDVVIPTCPKVKGSPEDIAAFVTFPKVPDIPLMTPTSDPDRAKRNGAATIEENVIKIA